MKYKLKVDRGSSAIAIEVVGKQSVEITVSEATHSWSLKSIVAFALPLALSVVLAGTAGYGAATGDYSAFKQIVTIVKDAVIQNAKKSSPQT